MYNSGGSSVTLFGGAGNDTLGTAGGSHIELAGEAGNNLYVLAGSGDSNNPASVTLNNLDAFGASQADSDAIATGTNTISFASNVSGVSLNLGQTGDGSTGSTVPVQQVTADLQLSLVGQFQNAIGTAGNDSIVGGSGPSEITAGGGNDTLAGGSGPATLVAGGGNDSLVASTGGTTFKFAGSQFGSDLIDPPGGTNNSLDFSQFGGPVAINLASTAAQVVSATAQGQPAS